MKALAAILLGCVLAVPAAPGAEPKDASPATNTEPVIVIQPIDYPPAGAISETGRERLTLERGMIAREMHILPSWRSWFGKAKPYLVPMPKAQVDELVAKMNAGQAGTPQDNIRLFAELMSGRLEQFRKGYEHYKASRWLEAVAEWNPLLAEKVTLVKIPYQRDTMPPYAYCITRFLRAECHGRLGHAVDCMRDYQVVMFKLPHSVTFMPYSCLQTAKVYEEWDRGHYSAPILEMLVANTFGCLSDMETLRLRVRSMKLMRADPFRLAMQDSADSLARLETAVLGPTTQFGQTRLVGNLSRLLIDPVGEPVPFMEYTLAFTGQAIEAGSLPAGKSLDNFVFSNQVDAAGSDDWGQLRPRERQELLQMFIETYPDRYRDMLEQYFRNVSDKESRRIAN